MTISVTCGCCKATFRAKDEHAGKRGKCPRCQAALEIPPPLAPQDKNAAIAQRPRAKASPHLVMQQILQAFQGDIQPTPRTAAYRVSILFLTLGLLVLPALYLALIAAIAHLLL